MQKYYGLNDKNLKVELIKFNSCIYSDRLIITDCVNILYTTSVNNLNLTLIYGLLKSYKGN